MSTFDKIKMNRVLVYFLTCLVLGGAGAWPAHADPIKFQKGPILHYIDGKMQVRIQGSPSTPKIEYRKGDKTTEIDMSKDRESFYEAFLPDTVGEYRVVTGNGATDWIPLPSQAKDAEKITFVAYGDNRTGSGNTAIHRALLKNMLAEGPAFVLHTGDLVAYGDQEELWDEFYRQGLEIFRSVPFQPTIGNHDISTRGCFVDYCDLGADKKSYYYFRYGPAHFIALDTTRYFDPGSPQYKFLESTLKKIPEEAPAVVFFHHTPFNFGNHGEDEKVKMFLVPLFEKYKVDLVIAGHDHNYQRIGPINGVLYIVTGGGGAPLYQVRVQPNSTLQKYKAVHHYVVIEIDKTAITGTMKNSLGRVEDSFSIPLSS